MPVPYAKAVVEFIGTFFLVFTVGMTVKSPDAAALAPLAIGSALMVMIYAGGHFSGGHYNPAVTLGVTLRGKMTWADASPTGSLSSWPPSSRPVASVYQRHGVRRSEPIPSPISYNAAAWFLGEFLFTFALVYVVLNSATAKGTAGNSFYGLAIGFTVVVGAFAVGPVSGGAFNPAVGLGVTVMGLAGFGKLIVYLIADFLGGAAAAYLFNAFDMGGDKLTA